MKHTYKLSICMMVKNEEKNLERCLSSFNIFLNNPSVELIIIDTGSTDNTVEIAKKYTSKIYFHEWNNNFSEMRNRSISYGKGEWILIVDADECLEDPNPGYKILMESNLLNNYSTVQFQIKNYLYIDDKSDFSIAPQPRMFRNDGTFRYDGTVHNQPKYKTPILDIDILIGHYGYIISDEELMEKKFKRTTTILKNELEKNPSNIYYQFQLAISYSMYKDHNTALIEARKAYFMIQQKNKKDRANYAHMYGMYARTSFENGEWDETIKICKEGIALQSEYIDLYFILAKAFIRSGERKEAVKYFKKYIDLYSNYTNLKIAKNPTFAMYNIDDKSRSIAYSCIAAYYYDNKEYDKIYKCFGKILDKSYRTQLACKTLIKLEYFTELRTYYDDLDDEDIKNIFTVTLENEMKELEDEKRIEIYYIFKNNANEYGLFNRIRVESNSKIQLIKEFFAQYDINKLPVFFGSIFKELAGNDIVMLSCFKKINTTMLRQYIRFLIDEYKEMNDYFSDYLIEQSNKIRTNDFQSNRVYVAIANVILTKAMEKSKSEKRSLEEKHIKIFNLYLEKGFYYLSYMYDMRKVRMIYDTLDTNENKFFMIMYLVKEAVNREDFMLAIKYIREALKEFPHMSMALQEYQKSAFKDIYI